MTKHRDEFDARQDALHTTPVLGYPDFSKELGVYPGD